MVGDTAQLGNARVDIPIAIRTGGNAKPQQPPTSNNTPKSKGAPKQSHKQ